MRKKSTACSGLEWNGMLGLADQLKRKGMFRDYLLIIVGCHFGLRIGDLLILRWEDILEKHELTIREKKTKKLRRITINPRVSEAVNLCYKELSQKKDITPEGYLFANRWKGKLSVSYINRRLKFIFKEFNVEAQNASSHTLRKTFGRRVYEKDNKSERALIYLSDIFSHASISTTRLYIGITQEQIADLYLSL